MASSYFHNPAVRYFGNNMLNKAINEYLDNLLEKGYKIMVDAARRVEVNSDTNNMADAWAVAVYFKGKRGQRTRYLDPTPDSTAIHKGWKKHNIQAGTGRGYLRTFFNNFRPSTDKISLIIVNVIYYTSILEQGKHTDNGRKYKIISQIDVGMNALAKELGASLVGIGINRGRIS